MMQQIKKSLLLCLAMLSVISGCILTGNNEFKEKQKDITVMNNSLYPVMFADNRRSSFINTSSDCKGVVSWEELLTDSNEKVFNARGLLLSGDQIFVYSNDLIKAFNSDGAKEWEVSIRPGSPVSINNKKIYFRNPEAYDKLSAVNFKNQKVDQQMWILESDGNCYPLYIEPLDDSFLALCQCISPPEQGASMFLFYKKKYETEHFIWVDNLPGKSEVAPLHFKNSDHFVVFSKEEILIYNSAAERNGKNIIKRFPVMMEKIISASGDETGSLYVFGENKEQLLLVSVDQEGKENWRWSGGKPMPLVQFKQPPVVGIDETVHLVNGNNILTIKDGNVVSEFSVKGTQIDYCSAISDGNIFITAGQRLYQLGISGSSKLEIKFNDIIKAPPVVDSDGNVYIVTASKLIKII